MYRMNGVLNPPPAIRILRVALGSGRGVKATASVRLMAAPATPSSVVVMNSRRRMGIEDYHRLRALGATRPVLLPARIGLADGHLGKFAFEQHS